MEIPNTQNKMIEGDNVANKDVQPTTAIAASVLENDYFYPESNGYKSISVRAATLQDAQKIYLAKRKPVSPEPEKVEDSTQNNNA